MVADKPAADTLWIHDDLDLDSLDLDEELAKLEEQELQLSQEFLAFKPEQEQPLSAPPQDDNRHDEAWAESLLHAEQNTPRLEAKPSAPAPRVTPPASSNLDAPIELRPAAPLKAERNDDAEPEEAERTEPAFGGADIDEVDDTDYALPGTRLGRSERNEPNLRNEHLLDLTDEPLQLDWQENRKPWGRWLAWGLINLLALGALATQYVAYHFEELARQDQYRPWFEQLCPEIGCQLPSKVDIEQIKSSNLVVRSHPEFRNSLVVDAILYNRAPFAQPFPLLELRFADISGQLLASRRFKPGEYLAGELAGQAEMPPQTPIHVSLEILDPGTKAVNYSLSFHSPE